MRAVTHGTFVDRIVLPDADELVAILYAEIPHLAENDYLAVRDYAIAQIRAWRLASWLEKHGDFDARGRVRPAVEQLRRWLERAEKARSRLGLDPVSRSALQLDQTALHERLRVLAYADLEEGRRLREDAEHWFGKGQSHEH
jgi:hypothetical protein